MRKPLPGGKNSSRPKRDPFVKAKCIWLRQSDLDRLDRLAEKLDRDHSWLIRRAIEEYAVREGVG